MSEFKREFEEAFENEKDLEITLSKAMTYILYLERETQSLEEQNKELIEFAKEMREIGKLNPDRLPEYTDIIYHHANDLITRITGGERDE